MNLVTIVGLDGKYKVVEQENPKGTPFGDSECLMEAVVGASLLCEGEIVTVSHRCNKCEGCHFNY